jgi:uncharacterized repeat protein (TIGR01451 family)
VDFNDADTYYRVSTVNYLAAGSCNFNDSGQTLWPLDQIVNDTQLYVRDSVIHYITNEGTITPTIEGRLVFLQAPELSTSQKMVTDANGDGLAQFGEVLTYTINITNTGGISASIDLSDALPDGLTYVEDSLQLPAGFTGEVISNVLETSTVSNLLADESATIIFDAQVTQVLPYGESFSNQVMLADQYASYTIAPAVIPMAAYYNFTLTPLTDTKQGHVGETVEYVLHLMNTSNITETFTFSYTGNLWDITLPVTSTELGAGDELDILVDVTIPQTAAHMATDMVTISITSAHEKTLDAVLTTTALRYLSMMPVIFR